MIDAKKSYVISVLGGKGGVGKSFIASNLALSFLLDTKRPTLLIDADPDSYGDISLILGLKPRQTILDAAKMSGPLAVNIFKEFIATHNSGLSFIPVSNNSTDYAGITAGDMLRVMDASEALYSFVVVDCGSRITEQVLAVLEHSTIILVVTTPEIISLRHSRYLIDQLQSSMFPPDMIKVILNRYDPVNPITPQIVQSNVSAPILAAVQEDIETCNSTITKGRPAMLTAPKSMVSRNIYQIERALIERGILDSLYVINKPRGLAAAKSAAERAGGTQIFLAKPSKKGSASQRTELKRRIHKALIENMDLKKMDVESKDDPNKFSILYEKTKKAVIQILEHEDLTFLKSREDRASLIKEILDEALALGPLEDLIADEDISEIMVNGAEQIYIERKGKLLLSNYDFSSSAQLMGVIERILAPIGRRIDEKSPYCDARLSDGSRVHAIIPPLAIDGPTLTIRKFKKDKLKIPDLIKFGSITEEISDFLKSCVEARLNIVISGGTGTGKTTLLNVLSSMIPNNERIITVEDSAELQLQQEHVVRLEAKPPNLEGEGAVTIRDLVRNTLRMRPDRIVVGECRGGEALDMLQAMNTGHDGSLTTVHSNNPKDCIMRLETLCLMAGMDLPAKAIREQIGSAINIIVQQSRLGDGSRKVTYITEIVGMHNDQVVLNDVFLYKQSGVDKAGKAIGKYVATGYIPKFVETLETKGIKMPRGLFSVS